MTERITRYEDFFLYYLREHKKPSTRAWHYFGTTLVLAALIYAVLTGTWWVIAVCLLLGYGPAWIGHFFFERNKPATFQYPLWSLLSDFKMYALWISGRLQPWLQRAGADVDIRE